MRSKVSDLLSYLLYSTALAQALPKYDIVGEYLTYENAQTFVSGNVTRKDNTYLLAICNRVGFFREINCNIKIMKLTYDIGFYKNDQVLTEEVTRVNSCNLTSTLANNRALIVKQFPLEIDFLGITSKILITWNEISSDSQAMYKKIAIVDMSNCQAQILELSYFKQRPVQQMLLTNLLVHSNTFDVFISDKGICGKLEKCRVTYDQLGVTDGPPKPFDTSLFMFKTVMAPAKTAAHPGFYVFVASQTDPHDVTVEHISEHGNLEKQLNTTVRHNSKTMHLITSSTNGQFTICGRLAKQTICDQFGAGMAIPKLSYAHEHASESDVAIDVYNLIDGGYLLIILTCENHTTLTCSEFEVTKVTTDKNTKILSKIGIELKCDNDLNHLSINTSEENETICFHLLCMWSTKKDDKFIMTPNSLLQCISGFEII
ncbi:hypothetical protein QAD02_009085 [Eretmocerus hayati]|uniref:Uncharacterized protein n=1 Tax=Eretmocerus hayati TaxID=131215 RepID=A0ACC2NAQ6_9HYME|nr:hypothetical protein QAD02_009085 [Eretmocerus hayati]